MEEEEEEVFIIPSHMLYLSLSVCPVSPPPLILVFMSYFFNVFFPPFILSTFRSHTYISFLLPQVKLLEHASDQHVHLVSRLKLSVFLPPLYLYGIMFMPVKVLSELIYENGTE